MKAIPYSEEAYQLLHDGTRALALVERNGIKVDVTYLDNAIKRTNGEIAEKDRALKQSKVAKVWLNHYRTKTNYNSGVQLGKVLFDLMGYASPGMTKGGKNHKTDEDALETVDHPFVKDYLQIRKMQKGVQFLVQIKRETCGRYLHPFFNLNIPRTYRSSSDSPNFQNLPVRDTWMKDLVRRCIIARKRRCIVEVDYGGIEVRVAYCYHLDPTMKTYLLDKTKDMHKDMAMECYKLSPKEMTGDTDDLKKMVKNVRYCGKNMFVFPQFYGSWWKDCAAALWKAMSTMHLTTGQGVPLREHLASKGITELGDELRKKDDYTPVKGTFEYHIHSIEKPFWEDRFPVYAQWKKDWYSDYLDKGWFISKTGFISQGYMAKNEVINYPVQGSAFHCLLWSLIKLVNGRLKKAGMRALIVGQIHDSIIGDVPEEEVPDYLRLVHQTTITDLQEAWGWITIPMEIEAEVGPVGGSWVDKKVMAIPT